jgi:hypothetical protein
MSNYLDFKSKGKLHPKFWDEDDKLSTSVKSALMIIAEEFLGFLGIDNIQYDDIRFTGSLANLVYHPASDIDLHIVVDYDKINEYKDVLRELFSAKAALWNQKHDIKIRGHEVEIYVEDISEPHHSTGVYSILNDAWISFPSDRAAIYDMAALTKKVYRYRRKIEFLLRRKHPTHSQVNRLIKKIKSMRSTGLKKDGPASIENLTFKALRRAGLLDDLFDLKNRLYDEKFTI